MAHARAPYDCGLGPALQVIGGKWKTSLLWRISAQPRRFGELRRLTPGISEKMLMQQLRELQADGLIERRDFHETPPRVEYSITAAGIALSEALTPLAQWAERRAAERLAKDEAGAADEAETGHSADD